MWRSLNGMHLSFVASALPIACVERFQLRRATSCAAPPNSGGGTSHGCAHGGRTSAVPISKEAARDAVRQRLRDVAVLHPTYKDDFTQYIPDFQGSERCTQTLLGMLPLQARGRPILFLTPDSGLDKLRVELDKRNVPYLMATGGLRGGIVWGAAKREHRVEIPLHELQRLALAGPLLVVVTGLIAVSKNGVRLGKGHGFFDTEWALLSDLMLVSPDTQVIAVAHDCQVIDETLVSETHDVTVDHVVTPSRVLQTGATKFCGSLRWDELDPELAATPLFQDWRRFMFSASSKDSVR